MTRTPFVAALAALSAFATLAGCGAPAALVVDDPKPPAVAWADLTLQLAGPQADRDKQKTCFEEARKAGVRIRSGAPVQATLYLDDDTNYVTSSTNPAQRPLGKWTTEAICRVAIAVALKLEERVIVSKQEPAPGTCRLISSVEGSDNGFAFIAVVPGSYEAALVTLQLAALRMNGNLVVVDAVRQIGLTTALNGRAFACPAAAAAAPLAPVGA